MRSYEGLLTAMVTPFAANGSVDEERAVALGRHLLGNGSHGLVVCGTTGESATLTDDEQRSLIATMVAELGDDGAIVAGAGSNDTRHAVHLTEAAVEAGAHAILSVTPYYNKPNARGVRAHFEAVARAAGGVPVIVYNIPSRTALNLAPDFLAELATVDGIEAVKQANSDELQPIEGLAVLAGNDDVLAACMDMGGAGGICVASHVVGPEMRRIVDDPATRAQIDAGLRDVYAAMFVTASPAPVKAALAMLGHDVGGLRLPLVEVDEAERAHVRGALAGHGLLPEASASAAVASALRETG
jgi:4-hydroxy-tetrahydrodipicolinate synthase